MAIVFDETYFEGDGEIGYTDYDAYGDPGSFLEDERDFILANFNLSGIACLEVGCAYGFLTKLMRDAGINWIGVDTSAYCISRDVTGGFISQENVVTGLSFGTNQFQFCASLYSFECLETEAAIDAAIAEIRRVVHNSQGDFYWVVSLGSVFPHYVQTRQAWEDKVSAFFPTAVFSDGIAFQPSVRTVIVRGTK